MSLRKEIDHHDYFVCEERENGLFPMFQYEHDAIGVSYVPVVDFDYGTPFDKDSAKSLWLDLSNSELKKYKIVKTLYTSNKFKVIK